MTWTALIMQDDALSDDSLVAQIMKEAQQKEQEESPEPESER